MFPGANAQVYYNEEGEPIGWDYPHYDEPSDPDWDLPTVEDWDPEDWDDEGWEDDDDTE